jgi:hypothetical protein
VGRPEGWLQKSEGNEGLQGVRQGVCAKSQQEAQHLQPIVSIGNWQAQCNEALGKIWEIEPNVPRVSNGVSKRVDRLKGLGNAVVPQIPEIIGRAIMQAERIAA